MTSAAQQDSLEEHFALQATGTEGCGALRQTVAERLARHRTRRAATAQHEAQEAGQRHEKVRNTGRNVSRVREAVTARYEKSLSYREYLAAEAEHALRQVQAEADVADRNARAMAAAQIQLLQGIEEWNQPEPGPRELALEHVRSETRGELAHALADIALGAQELMREPVLSAGPATVVEVPAPDPGVETKQNAPLTEISSGGLTVKLFDGLETAKSAVDLKLDRKRAVDHAPAAEELEQLEQEIERRHATGQAAPHILETTPIPANLIEFPRQLIAPRKARPRLAEGPLREDAPAEPQLRIFEVEAEQIAIAPVPAEPAGAAGWQELLLESTATRAPVPPAEAQVQFTLPPQIAPINKRLLAGAVDGACLVAAVACFAEAALHLGGAGLPHAPKPLLGAAVAGTLLLFYTLYQMLFFSLNEATPGMRTARIGLCTFGDDNPSRRAMRRRVLATLLAACPLGVGLLWSFLDGDRSGLA